MVLEKMARNKKINGIFKKRGNWYIDYYVQGRRKREMIGPSKKLAEQIRNKRLIEVAENKHLDIKRIERKRLGEFVSLFIETYSKPNKVSWKDDYSRLNLAVSFFGSKTYLDEITPYHIEKFKKHKLEQGTKSSTINKYITILKTMYKKAIEWGNVETNPFSTVKKLREEEPPIRYLEKEEIARLLDACDGILRPIVITALNTGMRKGEIFNLKWSDVDLKNNFIYLYKTKNNERRVIPVNQLLRRTLIMHRERSTSEKVFPMKSIQRYFARALKCAKITNCRFHDLRHTFISHLALEGVPIHTVKELAGHKSIEMTMRYAHLSPDHKSKAIETIGNLMDTVWTPKENRQEIEKEINLITKASQNTYINACQ